MIFQINVDIQLKKDVQVTRDNQWPNTFSIPLKITENRDVKIVTHRETKTKLKKQIYWHFNPVMIYC